jgi:hypothetical protein
MLLGREYSDILDKPIGHMTCSSSFEHVNIEVPRPLEKRSKGRNRNGYE